MQFVTDERPAAAGGDDEAERRDEPTAERDESNNHITCDADTLVDLHLAGPPPGSDSLDATGITGTAGAATNAACDDATSSGASQSLAGGGTMSRAAATISNVLAGSISAGGPTSGSTLSLRDEEDLRRAYLSIIEQDDARAQLVAVAQSLGARSGAADPSLAESVGRGAAAGLGWQVQTTEARRRLFAFQPDEVATVGRSGMFENNITLEAPRGGLSRVHVVILPVPQEGHLIVCDVGSLAGVYITDRSGGEPGGGGGGAGGGGAGGACDGGQDASVPGARRPLIVGMNETVVLHLGPPRAGLGLVVNPKDCVVCMDAAREVAFSCGHFVCCTACANKVQAMKEREGAAACPICRRGDVRAVAPEECGAMGARTMAVHTLVQF